MDETSASLNGFPAAEVRNSLNRVLSSRVFIHSHRIRRFLQFVVEECLFGRQHRLKEYLIGLEVFNRRDAFDPRVDSIVRVEARRLRAKLEEYYRTEGREDDLRILLRKGSYVPIFEYRSASSNGTPWSARHSLRRSITVAPFNVAGGETGDALVAEEIRRRLAHVLIKDGYLQVVTQSQPPPDGYTADFPRPDYLVEGTIQQRGEHVRVLTQLFHVGDSSYIWSESADCEREDFGPVEGLARSLNLELASLHRDSSRAKRHDGRRPASDYYLQGRYYWKRATPESIRNSVTFFSKAVDSDSSYAAAWAALAEALTVSALFGFADPSEGARLKQAARQALDLDETLPEAHLAMGAALSIVDWNWSAGEQELQRAIQLDTSDTAARVAYGVQLACRGRLDAGLLEVDRALENDPASLVSHFVRGWLNCLARRFDESISQHQLVARLAPEFPLSYLGLGWAYSGKGLFDEAISQFVQASSLLKCRSLIRGRLGYCYARACRREDALHELEDLQEAGSQYAAPVSAAAIYCGLGDRDRALAKLEEALAAHDFSLPLLTLSPEFDSIRDDPRFASMREGLGL